MAGLLIYPVAYIGFLVAHPIRTIIATIFFASLIVLYTIVAAKYNTKINLYDQQGIVVVITCIILSAILFISSYGFYKTFPKTSIPPVSNNKQIGGRKH